MEPDYIIEVYEKLTKEQKEKIKKFFEEELLFLEDSIKVYKTEYFLGESEYAPELIREANRWE